MKITRIEVRTVAPEVQRFTWSFDLPEQFMTNTVVRIETDVDIEGVAGVSNYTSYDFDRYTAETIRHLAPVLIGRDPREHDQIYYDLRPRVFPLSPGALAIVDVAHLAERKHVDMVAGHEGANLGTELDKTPSPCSSGPRLCCRSRSEAPPRPTRKGRPPHAGVPPLSMPTWLAGGGALRPRWLHSPLISPEDEGVS